MPAVRFIYQVRGYAANNNAVTFDDSDANRVLQFSDEFVLTKDTSSTPQRITVGTRASINSLAQQVATLTETVSNLTSSVSALTTRVTALEEQRLTPTALKSADYTAVAWEHVLVDMAAASGNVTITMPTSPAPAVGDRVRISDVAAGGGAGVGFLLRVAATFAATSTAHYAASPYPIADIGSGGSVVGANAELVYVGTGWYLVAETCQPVQLT